MLLLFARELRAMNMFSEDVEIVGLDLTRASLERAQTLLERFDIKATLVQGSILDVTAETVGGLFDYIDCAGVLHHLSDPAAGLVQLAALLTPQGGMGLMVYGLLGRQYIYKYQDLMSHLVSGGRSQRRKQSAVVEAEAEAIETEIEAATEAGCVTRAGTHAKNTPGPVGIQMCAAWVGVLLLTQVTVLLLPFHPSIPSILPAFLPSFLPSCLPAFLPSCLPSFRPSFRPSSLTHSYHCFPPCGA
jgi:SAM-dependent methyltransferase